jgi:Ti-type conjugative transfer relaxase TraA
MAIYHFSAKVISRARGSSAVASAAYRSASLLHDERLGRDHDFSAKAGVVHREVMLPHGAPDRWADRATLWNEVEARERRKDAQLAREVEFALPRELSQVDAIGLARDFVRREFVARGMVADLNVHWDVGLDGEGKPHAHVMLALRAAGPDGFGQKVREWNATERLVEWRQAWADHANQRLAVLGLETQIDPRALKDQAIDLEPQNKVGPSGARREARGEDAERAEEHRAIARRNGERIIAAPETALAAMTHQQATFTDHALWKFLHRHTDGRAQFETALARVRASAEFVRLGRDGQGRERFTSRDMLAIERSLERAADNLAGRAGHLVSGRARTEGSAAIGREGIELSSAQRDAVEHLLRRRDLALLVGYAGAGKSVLLGAARAAWEAQGYRVRGAALSGMAAESLEGGSRIVSRTLASYEHAWARDREQLSSRDVLVIDEAGLVGSRQLGRVLAHAEAAQAKVVLVGDPEQLQAIEAGAAFRVLAERHGAPELTEVRRQTIGWQQEATRQLATGRTARALARYAEAGHVERHATPSAAQNATVDGWAAVRREYPGQTQVMLAFTRDDVVALNAEARARLRAAGDLGAEREVETTRGARVFAAGDRVVFLRNERELGVRNGTLGTIEELGPMRMAVRLDDGRPLIFDHKLYQDLDHGYATTIHKSQGITIDRAHVLASSYMDRHAAYVALSRHRLSVTLHHDAQAFPEPHDLVRTLARERAKDSTLDYPSLFAVRRGLAVEVLRGVFARFKPSTPPPSRTDRDARQDDLGRAQALARAWSDARRMRQAGVLVLPHQALALERAAGAMDRAREGLGVAAISALEKQPELAWSAVRGDAAGLLRAADREMTAGRMSSGQSRPDLQRRDRGLER